MTPTAVKALRALEGQLSRFEGAAEAKLALLAQLESSRLPGAPEVLRLHEALCFLRAYPDSEKVLSAVERMLRAFPERGDLQRHRKALADTGIAGTDIYYAFFWPTALWLRRRWPAQITVHWAALENEKLVEERLHLLALYAETPGLDEYAFPVREWIARLKGADETDAAFLIRRWEALPMTDEARETFYQEQLIPLQLAAGKNTPSRSRARLAGLPVVFQTRPLERGRPDLHKELDRAPVAVHSLSPAEGRKVIDLAREAMVTRSRDLDAFAYGDPNDVRLIDCGDGLQFAAIGTLPERRLLLESVYGFLTFKSGVPVGYVLSSALFGSSEVAYNVFETYRGAEAARIYGRVLAMLRGLFGSDAFTIYPYQLGHGNEEGLRSGAWWFYRKLGFGPRAAGALRLMREEERKMRSNPSHRSTPAVLRSLAEENLYLFSAGEREDVIGRLPLANVGLQVTAYLARRFGSSREQGARTCAREAAALLGLAPTRGFSRGERLAWNRWSPLLCSMPAIAEWSEADRRAVIEVIRAKGGSRESEFVRLFDAHAPLRQAIRELASRPDPPAPTLP